ncbi:GNAT family N-acetyltransferase [Aquicoccus porphyridii]|uniref:GNAT family N-acetyltransferase n=2 Tax=Aquicoccus porphyridii TaxID=1852029 RepID=A0A5A9ZVX1_9RHOB|nr:GNAT family N-acetyltransferase [Aquicoccus porphyridii]KAA0921201.1 GNAT family N-acetyltransferase [Aquicoccus porphyridii]RAI56850.1 GNAT family N-acetyltransferase [Rhodobacteraceae bacterium AsT-22]
MLEAGFHAVPQGHVATVVTYLEMRAPVDARPEREAGLELRLVERPDVEWYRALFRKVGAEDWMWFSRLMIGEDALLAVLHDPAVEVYVALRDGEELGLLELDFRVQGECEIAFFGLARAAIGQGAGRWLMNRALERAWREGVGRVHLHTCTLDSPQALDFYRRSGFEPVRREVEVLRDPRLSGHLPESAAPHVPILR